MNDLLEKLLGVTPGDLAGADEWTVRLIGVPENIWLLLAMLAAAAVLVVLTVRSYRREGDAPRRAKTLLTALRLTALAVLFLLLLQPAVVLRHKKTVYSTVVVLVDDSLSMRWADRYADESERMALAALLKIEPERLAGADRPTRLDAVKRALTREGGALARLAQDHPITLVRFSTASPGKETYTQTLAQTPPTRPDGDRRSASEKPSNAAPAKPAAPAAASASPAPLPPEIAAALAKLDAGGFETNLGRAVREALEKVEGRRVAALVVVSDGRNTAASANGRLTAAAELARARGIPIYAVAVGDPQPPKNILIAQLQGPGEVRKGATATMTAVLATRGYGGTAVTVNLARAPAGSDRWEDTGIAETVTLAGDAAAEGATAAAPAGGELQEVRLRVPMNETGAFVYRAAVKPRDDEILTTDNEATAPVKVSDEKVSVLLISGDAGWEFQYLRNYLVRHGEHFKVSTWQQNADADFNQEASTGMKRQRLPRTREDLFQYDAVILYDPRNISGEFDATFVEMLEEFVSRHHGGLAYMAGNKFTDSNLIAGGPFDALAGLLPVTLERDVAPLALRILQGQRVAWPVAATPAGLDHPLMQMEPDAAENERLWRLLPGIYWSHAVGRLKTLATALAVSGDPGRQTTDGRPEPLLAVQYYGKGRVLYLGFDGTWRWRYLRNAAYYDRFWSNAVDFLAAGRLEKKRILITAGGTVFDAGSDIRVRVEAYTRDFSPLEGKAFTVRLVNRDTSEATEHALEAVKPGIFEGILPAARTGKFDLVPKADAAGAADWTDADVAAKPLEVRLPEEEFRRPEADRAALADLADDPSRFLRLAEIDRLADRIPPAKLVTVTEVPRTLWNTLAALVIVGTLLLVEWALRKAYNMA